MLLVVSGADPAIVKRGAQPRVKRGGPNILSHSDALIVQKKGVPTPGTPAPESANECRLDTSYCYQFNVQLCHVVSSGMSSIYVILLSVPSSYVILLSVLPSYVILLSVSFRYIILLSVLSSYNRLLTFRLNEMFCPSGEMCRPL